MTTNKINEAIEKLAWQYVAGSGCANCWGDLHQGCQSTCRSSEEAASERKTFIEEVCRIATLAAAEEREACVRIVERNCTECDTCRVKPGSPILCQGCLNNRDSITACMKEAQAVIKPIRGYFVSVDGRVFSEKYGRRVELKQSEHKGYRRVCFSHENRRQHFPVHRLVAEAFIPNPDNKPFVNHKDGNKRNNLSHNLEWVTASENQRHAYGELGIRNGHTGYRYAKLYPKEELRSRLVELGVPRFRHNLAELGEMLPPEWNGFQLRSEKLPIKPHLPEWEVAYYELGYEDEIRGEVFREAAEADARAKMLIYLIEHSFIDPKTLSL